jgi:inorganic pyrophosphatase
VEAVKPGQAGWRGSFNAAFIAGSVMGFVLCSLALIVLFILINVYSVLSDDYSMAPGVNSMVNSKRLFECIAGYGLGGSSMALFGRVGGGIFTKAADVGADLSGKVAGYTDETGNTKFLDEDSPRNPATIADNVGDNVGDVAGMGSDLFGSFAEASCAALVISAGSPEIVSVGYSAFMFPLMVSAAGIIVCMLTSFVATHISPVTVTRNEQEKEDEANVETVLKVQLGVSALLMTIATLPLALVFLPNKFTFEALYKISPEGADTSVKTMDLQECHAIGAWICVVCGLWGGCLIGFITEYYTSHSYQPVKDVAQSCESGAAPNIIYGLALGYLSNVLPISLLAINVFISFYLCGMYGVALAALGMLGTLATCLSIDVYGPIADNAGGLAEMAEFPEFVRHKTDALDAAGNTTAAIGKGFAIGSAALVSLALFGGFVSRLTAHSLQVDTIQYGKRSLPVIINVLQPVTFAFLFMGAMLPYWFTAFCMKSVGQAADAMVKNVKKQFEENGPAIMREVDPVAPDYAACIQISTDASLREMIWPAMLVMGAPLLTGILFGVEAVCGLLVGSLISAVQLAISQSNSGGAWDNAKKYVEQGKITVETKLTAEVFEGNVPGMNSDPAYNKKIIESLFGSETSEGIHGTKAANLNQTKPVPMGKKTQLHQAAVIGDTVGDPLKDTSGPALNIVMKLMAILSLVFSDFFVSIFEGRGLFQVPTTLNLKCTAAMECPK